MDRGARVLRPWRGWTVPPGRPRPPRRRAPPQHVGWSAPRRTAARLRIPRRGHPAGPPRVRRAAGCRLRDRAGRGGRRTARGVPAPHAVDPRLHSDPPREIEGRVPARGPCRGGRSPRGRTGTHEGTGQKLPVAGESWSAMWAPPIGTFLASIVGMAAVRGAQGAALAEARGEELLNRLAEHG